MILLYILSAYTAFCALYLLVCAVAGHFYKPPTAADSCLRRMAVLLPAYREDAVIVGSARAALAQTYPADQYDVVVIADSLRPDTLAALYDLPIQVVEVSFETSTKAKALAAAFAQLPAAYDVAVVLDADNHMAPDCLSRLNAAFDAGYVVVQGHRTAKNLNTSVALLDAISEEINNHLFRKGHRALGLPSALIGSGMAFRYDLLAQMVPNIQVINGVDRDIEVQLIRQRIPIAYDDLAVTYDEKVQHKAVLEKQRTRWLAAQGRALRANTGPGLRALLTGNWGYADKVFQYALLPRVLLLGLTTALAGLGLLLGHVAFATSALGQLAVLLLALGIAIPADLRRRLRWSDGQQVVAVGFRFVRSLLNVRQARNRFLHTPHGP